MVSSKQKAWLFWIVVVVVLLLGVLLVVPLALLALEKKPLACFENDTCLELEVAFSLAERQQGLMHRTELAQNSGMLFVFDSSEVHSFWMKNTLIPLDIIWLDPNGTIVGIKENVVACEESPCPSYSIEEPSLFVLETNAGFVAQNNVHENQKVRLENIPT
ncbi:DUF192 domain-containing protein [Candidatus Micrarchaeota archaeon]|nr:DUF192 domain-containing protein [Candidatus Micrarchaeota archaeon]MBU1930529.1 DUF192 domain-containing protein [Candidatus Micrarchaeota archaeon]